MPNTGRRDEVEHPLQQPISRPQDGDKDQLLARQKWRVRLRKRRLDLAGLSCEIAGHFIAKQQRYLTQEQPKPRGIGFLSAHEGQLVPDQGVIDDRDIVH